MGLDDEYRALLRPGELMRDRARRLRRLPRFFYEIPRGTWRWRRGSPHFEVWEFLNVDVREAEALRSEWPRVPPLRGVELAAFLELLDARWARCTSRPTAATAPRRTRCRPSQPHCWGTAANVYRVGSDLLDTPDRIERYAAALRRALPFASIRPAAGEAGAADDHLHVDLGYVTVVPRGTSEQGS